MIQLRDMAANDREQLFAWRNLEEVAKYMYSDHPITAEEHARWFERVLRDPSCKYWIIQFRGRSVGVANLVGIDLHNSRCSWGMYVGDPAVQKVGVGAFVEFQVLSYVFETLKLNKLCCEVFSSNTAVISLHRKFGFQQEGCLRRHVVKNGQFLDVVVLGLLRSDWEASKAAIAEKLARVEKVRGGSESSS